MNVTALVAHPNLPVVFSGEANGCVMVYSSMAGKEKTILYSHIKDVFITVIACCKNNILASADAGGTAQIWKLERTATGAWSARPQILDASPQQSIRQLALSPEGEYLLVSAACSAAELVGSCEFVPSELTVWKWLLTRGPNCELLSARTFASPMHAVSPNEKCQAASQNVRCTSEHGKKDAVSQPIKERLHDSLPAC